MLKALRGGRKWRVFKRGRKEEIQNDDGETKKKDRVNGRADKDGCIFRLCFSSAVTLVFLFVTQGQTMQSIYSGGLQSLQMLTVYGRNSQHKLSILSSHFVSLVRRRGLCVYMVRIDCE